MKFIHECSNMKCDKIIELITWRDLNKGLEGLSY